MDRDGDEWEVLSFLNCQSNLGMEEGPGIRTWDQTREEQVVRQVLQSHGPKFKSHLPDL